MNILSFDLKTPKDFYNKLIEDYEDYKTSDNSSRIALNCAMTAWHLSEWIYHEFNMKRKYPKMKDYQGHVKRICPSLQIMHDIANGSKHYKLERHNPKTQHTEKKTGTFDNTFDFTFDRTMLKVVMQDGNALIFDHEIDKTIIYWGEQLQELEIEFSKK